MSNKSEDLGTDPVMEFLENAKIAIENNKNTILSVAVAIAIAMAGYSGFSYMKNKKLETAREAFGSASSLAITNQPDKAIEALTSVMDEFPGTVFETYSSFMIGNLLLQKEKYDEAEEFLQKSSKAGNSVSFVKGESLEALGTCREAVGDDQGAIEYYGKALKEESAKHRYPSIKWKLALLEKKLGNKDVALKYCDEIVSDSTAEAFKSNAENLKAVIEAL